MRGFIVGTIATALAFAVLTFLLKPNIEYVGEPGGLIVIALIAGVVNGLIKPVIKIAVAAGPPGDARPVQPRHQRRSADRRRVARQQLDLHFTIGGFPPDFSIEALVWAVVGAIVLSVVDTIIGHGRATTDRVDRLPDIATALRAAARRFGTPVYVTDAAAIDAARGRAGRAFPDPWIRQYWVKANDVAAVIAAVCGARRRASARTSSRAASGRRPRGRASRTTGSRSRASARPTPTCGRRSARARRGDPLLWIAIESADELAALAASRRPAGSGEPRRRPAPAQPGRRARDP